MKKRRDTTQVNILQKTVLKLPHELDESVNPDPPEAQPVMKQAAKDIARGLVDTDRGVAVDVTYKKQKNRV
jgi:hypothetical protein